MTCIEQLARAHWWHRVRQTTLASASLAVCKGAEDPEAQLAADAINAAWDLECRHECDAMQAALSALTLAGMLQPMGIAKV